MASAGTVNVFYHLLVSDDSFDLCSMVISRYVYISVLTVLNRVVRLSVGRAAVTIHLYAT